MWANGLNSFALMNFTDPHFASLVQFQKPNFLSDFLAPPSVALRHLDIALNKFFVLFLFYLFFVLLYQHIDFLSKKYVTFVTVDKLLLLSQHCILLGSVRI